MAYPLNLKSSGTPAVPPSQPWTATTGYVCCGNTGMQLAAGCGNFRQENSSRGNLQRRRREAGLQASRWESLGRLIATPGFCDEIIHLFLARELVEVTAVPEAHELLEVHWVPLAAALEQVYDGTIYDAKTMLGLTLAAQHLGL